VDGGRGSSTKNPKFFEGGGNTEVQKKGEERRKGGSSVKSLGKKKKENQCAEDLQGKFFALQRNYWVGKRGGEGMEKDLNGSFHP